MKKLTLVLFVLFATFAAANSAHAQVSTNFETFNLGSPNGQQGWSSLGSAGMGCAPYDHMISVNNGPSSFGSKSLRISNAVTSGCFGDQTFSASNPNEAGEATAMNGGMSGGTRGDYFEFSTQFSSTMSTYQEGMGVTLSADRGDGARMTWTRIEDSPTGLVVFFDDYNVAIHDFNPIVTAASGLSRTGVHTLRTTIQFVPGIGNDVVKVYVDGALVTTGTSWEDYFRDYEDGFSRTVDSVLFRTGGAPAPATMGNGFLFDNMNIKSGAIPSNSGQCKNGGFMNFVRPDGTAFKNQGDCVSFTANGK